MWRCYCCSQPILKDSEECSISIFSMVVWSCCSQHLTYDPEVAGSDSWLACLYSAMVSCYAAKTGHWSNLLLASAVFVNSKTDPECSYHFWRHYLDTTVRDEPEKGSWNLIISKCRSSSLLRMSEKESVRNFFWFFTSSDSDETQKRECANKWTFHL